MRTEQEILDLITNIAIEDARVRAVYLHGSRANPSIEKDKYSDFDVVYVVTETASFIADKEWIQKFGDSSFVHESYQIQNIFFGKEINDLSRRYVWSVMFKDGNHIDLLLEIVAEAMTHGQIKNKPIVQLLDKDGCLPQISSTKMENGIIQKPKEEAYTACCSAFWWYLSNVAKGIARDQLPFAKEQFHSKSVATLNRMIEWYIGTQSDFTVSAGEDGKYFKKYLPPNIYDKYTRIYSDGTYANFWDAIFTACELFRETASTVGEFLGFAYNKQEESTMMDYLTESKSSI